MIKQIQRISDIVSDRRSLFEDLDLADTVKKIPIPRKTKKIIIKLTNDGEGFLLQKVDYQTGWIGAPVYFGECYAENYYYLTDSIQLINEEKAAFFGSHVRELVRWSLDFEFVYNDPYNMIPNVV